MVIRRRLLAAAALAAALSLPTRAQDQRRPTPEEWRRSSEPGEGHRRLAPLAGRWTFTIAYPGGPGGTPTEASGTSEFRWILGGRFLLEESKTTLAGQPFEWVGIHAYDNARRRHTSAWVDNLGTAIEAMEGDFEDGDRTLAYQGEEDHPGQGRVKVRWLITFQGPDGYQVRLVEAGPTGRESVQGTIRATRVR
jgi:hypothetical protein